MNVTDIRKFTAQLPPRILIHGAEGVGKTTIASKFPGAIFLQTEDGCSSGLEINSFGLIDNFADLRSAIGALASEQHHYQTIVIDSLDATEELIWHDACRSQGWSSIESPGYGRGYVIVQSWWIDILKGLEFLRHRLGMSIVLLAHSAIETINDPRAASYTSYQLRLHKRARGLVQDWCDAIGFLAPDLHVQSEEVGFGKKRNRADDRGHAQRPIAWAVTTSDGIILFDTIWEYSIADSVVGGLKKLGLDPARVKYAIVTHAHRDHIGGAKLLQDTYGTRIIMSEADWKLAEANPRLPVKPKRDMAIADGHKLTLGDTTVTLHVTPGHTPGTISSLIPVKDGGRQHLAAQWGGTSLNFELIAANFHAYINSAQRFGNIVKAVGADVLIGNHTNNDGSKVKLPAVLQRKPGDRHPYVIGDDAVARYVKVAEECARGNLLRLKL
jgi:hypothetical protein